ncbi:hypothetical protein CAC42_1910 [Sphaceloma murrayae]|uniref:Mediator of RNA polymerase II transcription subunit 1 n=1 Tax=Sphaceloma murrayae TaxID=2082308 RepID=A0A2K1QVT4_9PEZI|nr:hypothetical protein CAC42_1910 [Sphaceloma murrayae]
MSTPTPHPQPTKHATPSHAAATPRSVPSPALARQQPASKQPLKAPSSVPMAPSLSQTSNASGGKNAGLGIHSSGIKQEGVSPAFANSALGFASPATGILEGMGMTPSLGMDAMGGVGMGMTFSDMGMTMERGKRDEDEERRKKVAGVLDRIGGRRDRDKARGTHSGMGRVSDEGVRRVGRWAGFDVEVESKYTGKEWEGNRPVVVAGRNAVLIDLAFKNTVASKVEVTFSSEKDEVTAHQAGAAKVLKDSLTPRDGVALINTRLDRFAENLERLGRLDKLSTPSINCVEAVTGIYVGLKKLYENEKEAAKSLFGDSADTTKIEQDVIFRKSGRPGMHVNERIGLSLDYWQSKGADQEANGTHSLELTVEQNDPSTFPSIRISNDWISDRVVKPPEESSDPTDLISDKPILDWLEPSALLSTAPKDAESMAVDDTPKPPNVRFVARLHPAVVVPYATAGQILQSCGLSSMPPTDSVHSYETVLLNIPTTPRHSPSDTVTTCHQAVFVPKADIERDVQHRTDLYVPKPEYGFRLSEIPFSHPRQIIDILPLLRQWAHLGSLLVKAFPTAAAEQATTQRPAPGLSKPFAARTHNGKRLALDSLLDPGPPGNQIDNGDASVKVDIALSTSPPGAPSVTVFLPIDNRVGSVSFSIGRDGQVIVTAQDVVDVSLLKPGSGGGMEMDIDSGGGGGDGAGQGRDADGEATVRATRRLGRALEVVGDIGVWVEWIRKTYG